MVAANFFVVSSHAGLSENELSTFNVFSEVEYTISIAIFIDICSIFKRRNFRGGLPVTQDIYTHYNVARTIHFRIKADTKIASYFLRI